MRSMKKRLIVLIASALVLLIGVSVWLCVRFVGLYRSRTVLPEASTEAAVGVLDYANTNWPSYRAEYDEANALLTLRYPVAISYEDACSFGQNVYCDENAPETYLNEAAMIALAVRSECAVPALHVRLCYDSSDGKTIFYAGSDGAVWTCWGGETAKDEGT